MLYMFRSYNACGIYNHSLDLDFTFTTKNTFLCQHECSIQIVYTKSRMAFTTLKIPDEFSINSDDGNVHTQVMVEVSEPIQLEFRVQSFDGYTDMCKYGGVYVHHEDVYYFNNRSNSMYSQYFKNENKTQDNIETETVVKSYGRICTNSKAEPLVGMFKTLYLEPGKTYVTFYSSTIYFQMKLRILVRHSKCYGLVNARCVSTWFISMPHYELYCKTIKTIFITVKQCLIIQNFDVQQIRRHLYIRVSGTMNVNYSAAVAVRMKSKEGVLCKYCIRIRYYRNIGHHSLGKFTCNNNQYSKLFTVEDISSFMILELPHCNGQARYITYQLKLFSTIISSCPVHQFGLDPQSREVFNMKLELTTYCGSVNVRLVNGLSYLVIWNEHVVGNMIYFYLSTLSGCNDVIIQYTTQMSNENLMSVMLNSTEDYLYFTEFGKARIVIFYTEGSHYFIKCRYQMKYQIVPTVQVLPDKTNNDKINIQKINTDKSSTNNIITNNSTFQVSKYTSFILNHNIY